MKFRKRVVLLFLVLVLGLVQSSCGAGQLGAPTATSQPTASETLAPTRTPVPSRTPSPTLTPPPTRTPNLTATQRYEEYNAEVQKYFDLGYLETTEGRFARYDNFTQEWAQLRWYRYWTQDDKVSDFFMSAHFKWSSAYRNADVSGCGFLFAIQENGDHFAVFLDRTLIRFLNADQSANTRRVNVTRGTGRVNFNNPADQPVEADFTVIVKGTYVYVLVDGEVVGEYSLPQNRILDGNLGLSVLSGTNKDYGTRCEMTNIHAWIPNK